MFDFDRAWTAHWALLGLTPPPEGVLAALLVAWDEPQRRYHTLQHLGECLVLFDESQGLACQPGAVALALWFHDAIYDPTGHGNEAASAAWATQVLVGSGAAPAVADAVEALILATRHDAAPEGGDECLLVDIDLAILGADPARFDEYEHQIRDEYAFVPELTFRARRAEILQQFLRRPRIYSTLMFADRFEAAARRNLARAIAALA